MIHRSTNQAAPSGSRSDRVAGVLLAAGTSSRMGSNKLFFTLEEETLLRRAARRGLAAGCSPLVVVLGHQAERAERELAGLQCQAVLNPRYAEGMATSIIAGVAALPPEVDAAVVLLADMPLVTSEMISGLIDRYLDRGPDGDAAPAAPVVVSAYAGVEAPPMLYDRSLFPELLAMAGGRCGKQVIQRHRHEAAVFAQPAAALADLDVPEDYERVKAEVEGG